MARTLGAKDLSPQQKGRILARKNVREWSNLEIAVEENVHVNSVKRINNYNVTGEVLEYSQRYAREVLPIAEATALKGFITTFETVDQLPADRAMSVAEKSFNIARTIREQSTTNDQKIELVIKFINNCFTQVEQKALADPNETFEFTRTQVIEAFCVKCNVSPELVAPLVRECLVLAD